MMYEGGNDYIDCETGNDTVYGDAGNDQLIGDVGDDHYYYRANGSVDVIDNTGGGFDGAFFIGIARTQLSFHRDGDDLLVIGDGDIEQQVKVTDHFLSVDFSIDYIQSDGGSYITSAQIAGLLTALPGSTGGPGDGGNPEDGEYPDDGASKPVGNDQPPVAGVGGGDVLLANDVLIGGAGNDKFRGGAGNDTYHFAAGDGQDGINNLSNTTADNDMLSIEGIVRDDLWLSRQGDSLVVDVIGSEDSVTVQDWYASSAQRLDAIEVGSSTLYANQVDNLVSAMAAFGAPAGGEINLSQVQRDQLNAVIAANWQ